MKAAYFRELKRYTKEDIATLLGASVEQILPVIRKLKSYGILKAVKSSALELKQFELSEQEVIISDIDIQTSEILLVFTYVGVVTVDNYIFKCYPKYIVQSSSPLTEMKQVLQVIARYDSREQILKLSDGLNKSSGFDMLSSMLFLINDYLEHGVYSNQKEITELDGEGEILWEKTIDETYAFIHLNTPYYLNLYTHTVIDDDFEYFRRLHSCIVTECSRKLHETELDQLFSISGTYPSDEYIDDFGDRDHIIYRIEREMNVQFVTRKQMLLKVMHAFLSNDSMTRSNLGFSMYGTNTYNLIWEKVCSEVFGNMLGTKLSNLPMRISQTYSQQSDKKLIQLIDKPLWRVLDPNANVTHRVKDTLTPDLISIYKVDNSKIFGIFDAKYYNIKLDHQGVAGHPGVGDITKQYLYQEAYKSFIEEHSFENVINAFLFPSDQMNTELIGEVELSIFHNSEDEFLKPIKVVKLSAKKMYSYYLNGQRMSIQNEFPFV
ncbi:LlaJI family restriction endonuclease [Paenibacillus sp. 2003]|uniref:LlaJI family restriction endonuclease n=1 Tax=Paenibacillus sp. 2003 TaxID=2817761 RepID=UPI0028589D0F|nr:LlaJI family restriction endonuclease [Paenibacillus sp. 2003]MDR6720894.1 hypothetical protein [Paenibacillus sp. 2003]